MKRKNLILAAASLCLTAALITSCSPKVYSEANLILPAQPLEAVQVFEPGDNVPDEAIGIGTVAVRDMGFATRCKYDNVVHMAKQRTAETGGNGLLITEHKKPNFWGSSCHQVTGTMLYISENGEISDSLRRAASMKATQVQSETKSKYRIDVPSSQDIFGVNAGVSFLNSRIETPWGDYDNRAGFNVTAHYDHLWSRGVGVGALANYNTTSIHGQTLSTFFVGPEVVYGLRFAYRWYFDVGLGAGYGYYNDGEEGHSGFGSNARFGIDYLFNEKVGLSLMMNAQTIHLKKPKGYELKKNEFYGVSHYGIELGLQFYL